MGNRVLQATGPWGPQGSTSLWGFGWVPPAACSASAVWETLETRDHTSLSQGRVQVYNPQHGTRGGALVRQLEWVSRVLLGPGTRPPLCKREGAG